MLLRRLPLYLHVKIHWKILNVDGRNFLFFHSIIPPLSFF